MITSLNLPYFCSQWQTGFQKDQIKEFKDPNTVLKFRLAMPPQQNNKKLNTYIEVRALFLLSFIKLKVNNTINTINKNSQPSGVSDTNINFINISDFNMSHGALNKKTVLSLHRNRST